MNDPKTPEMIKDMEAMLAYARKTGAERVSVRGIIDPKTEKFEVQVDFTPAESVAPSESHSLPN